MKNRDIIFSSIAAVSSVLLLLVLAVFLRPLIINHLKKADMIGSGQWVEIAPNDPLRQHKVSISVRSPEKPQYGSTDFNGISGPRASLYPYITLTKEQFKVRVMYQGKAEGKMQYQDAFYRCDNTLSEEYQTLKVETREGSVIPSVTFNGRYPCLLLNVDLRGEKPVFADYNNDGWDEADISPRYDVNPTQIEFYSRNQIYKNAKIELIYEGIQPVEGRMGESNRVMLTNPSHMSNGYQVRVTLQNGRSYTFRSNRASHDLKLSVNLQTSSCTNAYGIPRMVITGTYVFLWPENAKIGETDEDQCK